MCGVLAAIVALSTRMKFGLGFAVVSVVLFSFSYWQISSSLDEAQTDGVDCGGWDPEGKVDVNFVAPPSEPPVEEDEFADLEAELDSLVS